MGCSLTNNFNFTKKKMSCSRIPSPTDATFRLFFCCLQFLVFDVIDKDLLSHVVTCYLLNLYENIIHISMHGLPPSDFTEMNNNISVRVPDFAEIETYMHK